MNIKEINEGIPSWSVVLALGFPLAFLIVALPLIFNFRYRKITEYINQRRIFFRIAVWVIGIVGLVIAIVIPAAFLGFQRM